MRSEFIIYWFDDSLDFFNAEEVRFKSIINSLKADGFSPKIKFFTDSDPDVGHRFLLSIGTSSVDFVIEKIPDYSKDSIQHIDFNDCELVVVDYNLSAEWKWDVIVQHIRDNAYYTDILFYSSDLAIPWSIPPSARWEDPKEHNLRIKIGRDAIYCSARANVFNKLQSVLDTLIKKMQWLNSLRWLVMAETSDIDELNRKILLKICVHYSSSIGIGPSATQGVNEIKIGTHILLRTYSLEQNYKDIIYDFDKTSSVKLYNWVLYSWRLRALNTTWLCNCLNDFDTYKQKTKRNILAHQPEEDTSTKICMKIQDISTWRRVEFREQDLKNIRKYIREHKKLLTDLYNALP